MGRSRRTVTRLISITTSRWCTTSSRDCLPSAGSRPKAEESLLAALEAVPTYVEAMLALANVRRRFGRLDAALSPLIELLRRDPYNIDALLSLSEVLLELDRHRDASDLDRSCAPLRPPARGGAFFSRDSCLPTATAIATRSRPGSAWSSSTPPASTRARRAGESRTAADLLRIFRSRQEVASMAIEGPLRELGIHDVFQLLDLSRKTGALTVTSVLRDNQGTVYFDRGSVVFAAIRSNPHPLGELLLRAGKITEADLARARDVQRTLHSRRKLGELLVESGSLTSKELERQVRFQVEEVVFELMSWREGFFSFEEQEVSDASAEAHIAHLD